MAGDWIKMETDLYRSPKVIQISQIISQPDGKLARFVSQNCQSDMSVTRNVTRNAVVGALVSVWGVLRRRGDRSGDDLVVEYCPIEVIDELSDIPGFGEAMRSVGWVRESSQSLVLPDFFKDKNIDPKQTGAERQRRYRERLKQAKITSSNGDKSDVTRYAQRREEKRREKKKKPPTPFKPEDVETLLAVDGRFRPTWSDYCRHRREIKHPLTRTATLKAVARLESMGIERALAALNHTMSNGWQGIREPDQQKRGVKEKVPDPDELDRQADELLAREQKR